ncbi:hypothetical protein CDL15_Pgr015147 [Punica granatum]|uniref:Patellin-3-like n=1 Tax=Punica granatum TaxID=22663 RepID=A0A218VZJ2_PUNGR|nr:hypothetical protein CDL15_Pgr015147 [Punica granatum]
MAEETPHKPPPAATEASAPEEEVVVVANVPQPEKPPLSLSADKELPPAPEPEPEPEPEPVPEKENPPVPVAEEEEKPKAEEEDEEDKKNKKLEKVVTKSSSFKEESNVVDELPESQKKALDELKSLIQEALSKHEFTVPPPSASKEEEEVKIKEEEEDKPPKTEEIPPPAAEAPSASPAEEEPPRPEPEAPAHPPPPDEDKVEDKEAPPPPAAAVEAVVVEEVVEKVTEVDEDGSKTVEAIKETIVEFSAPVAEQTQAPPKPADQGEGPAETKEQDAAEVPTPPPPPPEQVFIWGIPLLGDERSDVVLLKFLRARDFKVKDAFAMIKNMVRWRKEFGIEALLEEDLGCDLEKVVFMHGSDKKGHPVCYNVFGEFRDKELYQNTFSDEEKRKKFLKWRIQFLEKSIRKLDFSPNGVCTIVQVNDLKNSPGLAKRELRLATNQALQLLQDNYPEFLAKQVFINVPWWYLAFNKMISPFLTQRTKSKFVFAGPARSAEALFKYIAPEQVPVQYGGLSREGEQEFTTSDPATEVAIKPTSKHTVEFPISEKCQLVWEVRVVGWDVSYGAEFVPSAEGSYTVIVQKSRKIAAADETVICNSFKTGEPGKVVITVDNQSSKKKKLLYRSKAKPSSD